MNAPTRTLQSVMHELLAARAPEASICPSEVARAVAPDAWRALMDTVRCVAAAEAERGAIRITQGEHTVNPEDVRSGRIRGPLRLRRA